MMDEKRETLRVFFDGLDKGLWESPSVGLHHKEKKKQKKKKKKAKKIGF